MFYSHAHDVHDTYKTYGLSVVFYHYSVCTCNNRNISRLLTNVGLPQACPNKTDIVYGQHSNEAVKTPFITSIYMFTLIYFRLSEVDLEEGQLYWFEQYNSCLTKKYFELHIVETLVKGI